MRRKCSSGNVESSFDNPAKNFPVKIQFFLVKFQKKTKNQFFKSIFSTFFPSVHFCCGHVKCTFSNTAKCHIFHAKRRFFWLRDWKRSNKYSSLRKKTLKLSAAPVGYSFEKFDKNFKPKVQKLKRPQNLSKVSAFERNVLKLFPWTLWTSFDNAASIFCLIVQTFCSKSESELRNNFSTNFFPQFFSVILGCFFVTLTFCQKTKKLAQTPKQMNKYYFLQEKYSSQKNSSGCADCSCGNPGENLPTKRFLDQSPKKCERLYK